MKEDETIIFDHMHIRHLTQIIILSNTIFYEMEANMTQGGTDVSQSNSMNSNIFSVLRYQPMIRILNCCCIPNEKTILIKIWKW